MEDGEKSTEQLRAELQQLRQQLADQEHSLQALRAREAAGHRRQAGVPKEWFLVETDAEGQLRFRSLTAGAAVSPEAPLSSGLSVERLTRSARQALRMQAPYCYEETLEREGVPQAWRVQLMPARNGTGEAGTLVGSVIDLVEPPEAKDAMEEGEVIHQRLLDLLPDAVIFTDVRGRLAYLNAAGVRLVGATAADEVLGRPIWDFIHPEDLPKARERERRLRRGAAVAPIEQRIVRLDGSVVPIETASVPARYRGRVAALHTARDLSRRKDMEEALSTERESRALLYRIFHASPVPIGIARLADGRFIDANDAWIEFAGYGPEEMIGHTATELGLGEDLEIARPSFAEEILARDSLHDVEVAVRSKHGEARTALASFQRIQAQREPAVLAVLTDITDRKRIMLALQESETRFRVLADSAPVLIWMSEPNGRSSYFNQNWLAFTGRTLEQEVGDGWLDGIHPEDRDRVAARYDAALAEQAPFRLEYRLRRHDGSYRWVLNNGVPRYLPDGSFAGFIGSCLDIDERKQMEMELLEAKEQAEEMARLRASFLTNMTHEVRTPLTVILGFTSMLQQGVREEYRRFVRVIERSGRRLLLMLDSILDLAQLESGTLRVERQVYNIVDVVRNEGEAFRHLAEEKGLRYNMELPRERLYAEFDHKILTRVLHNLLDNAVKFTEEGEIGVAVQQRAKGICISIRDTGIGIDQAFLPYVFEEFSQESTGLERTHQGSGLGLSVSKRLIELVGGTIEVHSTKGEGSLFTICLPRASTASS